MGMHIHPGILNCESVDKLLKLFQFSNFYEVHLKSTKDLYVERQYVTTDPMQGSRKMDHFFPHGASFPCSVPKHGTGTSEIFKLNFLKIFVL